MMRRAGRRAAFLPLFLLAGLLPALSGWPVLAAQSGEDTPSHREVAEAARGRAGSTYIPLDSWMYPAAIRLYELGYLPTAYLGLRPWTRLSLAHMLSLSQGELLMRESPDSEASAIFDRLHRELMPEFLPLPGPEIVPESAYTRVRQISGPVLNDSAHLGSTFINDYGRPYQEGFNNVTGFSARGRAGRVALYARGEYQHAPAAEGYSPAVADYLAGQDKLPPIPQSTIPQGYIPERNQFRMLEANLSAHWIGHQFSFGKSDAWLGPARGASMAWGNNAENIYSFRINRIEPLYIPGLSRVIGLFRYDFFVGSIKGHNFPNDPWIHSEKVSFKPTPDLELGFERTVYWGGKGHVPVTIHTFLRSFFSAAGVAPAVKFSRDDPGARFSTFDVTYRIPWQNNLVTVYTDSTAHDDVFPISAPSRSGWRPGVYLSRLAVPRLDLRAEATYTDPSVRNSQAGQFLYWESVIKESYTNRNQLLGDWIGREGKGGQAWLTYHLAADQWIGAEYRRSKNAKDFIAGGTTEQSVDVNTALRPVADLEVRLAYHYEWWKAPLVSPAGRHNNSGTLEVTYFPRWRRP